MGSDELFGGSVRVKDTGPASPALGRARLVTPNRAQKQMVVQCPEELLPPGHRARLFWAILEKFDLSRFEVSIAARGSNPGRSATDRRLLLALWLYGMSEGFVTASEIAELCLRHDAYRWMCGGVNVCQRTLAIFRADHGEALDALLTDLLTVMQAEGMIDLGCVAQDGLRVRASAGGGSFRREPSLRERHARALARVEELKQEAANPDRGLRSRRAVADAERAGREMLERTERALAEIPKIRQMQARSHKKKSEQREPRASTTDPEARVMKMGDGGFRPAFNFQFATETKGRVIVGVGVENVGGDSGLATPMMEQVLRRTGVTPTSYLVDGGYVNDQAIEEAKQRGTTLFAPVPEPREKEPDPQTPGLAPRIPRPDPHMPRPDDTAALAEWRVRMGTDAAKKHYKDRAEFAEGSNAELRKRGLERLRVRGLPTALCVGLLSALAVNFIRYIGFAQLG